MNTKVFRRPAVIIALVLISAFLAVFPLNAKAASAESMDKLITTFDDGKSDGWALNAGAQIFDGKANLIAGGTMTTDKEMDSFMLIAEIENVENGFELCFGEKADGTKFTIKFDKAVIRLTNLTNAQGGATVAMGDKLSAKSVIKIEVIGGAVNIALKTAVQPSDALGVPFTELKFTDAMPSRFGIVSLSAYADSSVSFDSVKLYSLAGQIEIAAENYVPRPPVEPEPESKTLLIVLLSTLIPLGVAGCAAAVIIIIRKRKAGAPKGEGNEQN